MFFENLIRYRIQMDRQDLKIVFMGTPEFAVTTLKALVETGYRVVAVVTQPDKPVGRHGSVLQPSPVKQYALGQGLPVLQPARMKDPDFLDDLRSYDADLQVVVAFRMLPEVVWAMPRYGTFNVHAALLPQYRGAAPINWAIINGETTTGVTTFLLDHQIDTGRILQQVPFDIPDDADAEYVYNGLMHLGARVCLDTIEQIIVAEGRPETRQQEEISDMKPAPKIFKETCIIDWHLSAKRVYDFVRGLSPVPGAWTTLVDDEGSEYVLKIYRTAKTDLPAEEEPGTLLVVQKRLYIACADNLLEIRELQMAGKKRMDAQAFLNGQKNIENYFAR